jgi:hypothetical protein
VIEGHEDKVYRLKKSLYGLKQAPKAWYSRIDSYLIRISNNEPTLYTKVNKQGQILIVCLYVDDMIFTRNLSVDKFKANTKQEFEMTDLGLMRYFFSIEVLQSYLGIFVFQARYVMDVLKRFKMMNCKPTLTPIAIGTKLSKEDVGSNVDLTLFKRLVGRLMYLTAARSGIMYVHGVSKRFTLASWQNNSKIYRWNNIIWHIMFQHL